MSFIECITEPTTYLPRHKKTKSEALNPVVRTNFANALNRYVIPEVEEVMKLEYFHAMKRSSMICASNIIILR